MSKGTKKNTQSSHEENKLSKVMPKDAFSIKVMHDRALILSEDDKSDHSDEAIKTSYIKFVLGQNEFYGIPYHDVLDVKYAENITKVPMSPSFVVGVSYWHGKLIPIIDLAKYFNIAVDHQGESEMIVAAISNEKFIIGLAFNDVSGVDSYLTDTLDQNIAVNHVIKDQFIHGIHSGKTTILNVKNLLVDISADLMSKKGNHHE